MIGSSTKMRYIFKPQTNHHPFFNVKMLSKDSKGMNAGGFFWDMRYSHHDGFPKNFHIF